jgi:hypothetical protein
MYRKPLSVILFFMAVYGTYAQHGGTPAPMEDWTFANEMTTLNGKIFFKNQYAESYCEQDGYAIVDGRSMYFFLYDTYTYHNGNNDEIINRVIPSWIENMGYVIDFDNIKEINPNPNLASSVKALMQQRGCNISVVEVFAKSTVGYDYVQINILDKKTGIYRSAIYPLYYQKM